MAVQELEPAEAVEQPEARNRLRERQALAAQQQQMLHRAAEHRLFSTARSRALEGEPLDLEPASAIRALKQRFSDDEIADYVVARRTLARRRKRREPLSETESDRVLRMLLIGSEADRVFGNPEKASRWLRKPNPALKGARPIELLATEIGGRAVQELLGQIDHGMFI